MLTDAFVVPNDMSDLCRVCLQLPDASQYLDPTTIYDEEENLSYSECFTICTQIDLNVGDCVPHHLCKPCGIELQMSYDFHKKIEESKRVVEQFQRQMKEQTLVHTNQLGNYHISEDEKNKHVIEEKYIISDDDDVQNRESSAETQVVYGTQQQNEPTFADPLAAIDMPDEVEVMNVCGSEADAQYEVSLDNKLSSAKLTEDFEDHFEIEALEEETETLQIKFCENTVPIQERIHKTIKSEDNAEYVEYAVDICEEKINEENREQLDVEYELNGKDTEDQTAWQENVVAVANKEHLPIEFVEDVDEVENIFKISKDHFVVNVSSHDEALTNLEDEEEEEEEEEEKDLNIKITEVNENLEKNLTGRKRHVGSYSCDYCHRVYPNYSRMKTHRRCHESNRPKFSCTQCGRMYATKQARDCHVQTAHDKSGYTCNICSKVFAIRKSLEIHMRYHTGDFPFACTLCDRKFAQACHLTTHVNVKHNQIRFSCEYPNCGKFFTSSSSLRNHEYTHSIMPFECEYCEQGYPAKSKLRIHLQRKHGMKVTNEQLENMRVFHIMRKSQQNVPFYFLQLNLVSILDLTYSTLKEEYSKNKPNFNEDTIINTTITPIIPAGIRLPIPPGPPFICDLCGHSSNTKNLLASHRHRKHRQKSLPYQCAKCDKTFKSKEYYDKHVKRLSCERYPEFICEYCQKKIIGSANYEIHLRFHKKIYPFKCQECDKEFMLAVHLKEHVQTKHENKRYMCEVNNCGKLFQSQQSLKTHMYVHLGSTPFCCEYCQKHFSIRSKLRHHLQTTHNVDVSSQDLDRMLVSEEINLKVQVEPVYLSDVLTFEL